MQNNSESKTIDFFGNLGSLLRNTPGGVDSARLRQGLPMNIIDQGLIFDARSAQAHHRANFFVTMLRESSGRILVGFRRGSTKYSSDGNCCVAASEDDGKSWNLVCEHFDNQVDGTTLEVRSVALGESRNGDVLGFLACNDRSAGEDYYDADADTVAPSRIFATRSADGGRSWSASRLLDTGSLEYPVLSGPAVPLDGGRWLVTRERQEPESPGGPSVHSADATVVADDGTAEKILTVARDPRDRFFFYDQRQAYFPKTNRLIAAFWTYDREAEMDVAIHLASGEPATLKWETPFDTGISGQIAQPIPLPDGRLLLFYVHREPPGSMRLIASADSGRTWETPNELEVYRRGGGPEEGAASEGDYASMWIDMGKWSFGHPAGVVLKDGTVLLAYYAGPDERCLSIHWARVSP